MQEKKLEDTFKEYPSIENSKKLVKKFPKDDNVWIALEKVHGSNFSFICDGIQMVNARRNSPLNEFETFYGWQEIRDRYKDCVFQLFKEVKQIQKDTKSIVIFGEFFGGIYPHPSVQDNGKQPIQKGVYYSPNLEFMAFDLRVFPEEGSPFWMNYDVAMNLFEKCGLFYAKPLLTGTIQECFEFDIKINSTIPKLLNLPPLEKNIMEGIVIKSMNSSVTIPGKRPPTRAIFKYKNEKFTEINPKPRETLYEKQRNEQKESLENFYDEISRYINENRLDNLQSKIGPVNEDNLDTAGVLLFEDAFKDFYSDNEEMWNLLDEEKKLLFQKNSTSKVKYFLRTWLSEKK